MGPKVYSLYPRRRKTWITGRKPEDKAFLQESSGNLNLKIASWGDFEKPLILPKSHSVKQPHASMFALLHLNREQ